MGKHVKKKNSSTNSDLARTRRELGEDNLDVEFDYLEQEELPAEAYAAPQEAEPVYQDEPDVYEEYYVEPAPQPRRPAQTERPARDTQRRPAERPAQQRPSQQRKPGGNGKKSSVSRKKALARQKKRFKRGLTVYMVILSLIIVGLLTTLWIFLDRFQTQYDAEEAEAARIAAEAEQQQAYERALYQAPQRCFQSWLAQCDMEYWTDLWYQKSPESIDGRDRVQAELSARFDPNTMQAFKSLDYTAEMPVYVLKNGDELLARITLSGSELNWNISQVDFLLEGNKSASVLASSGSKVFCNGVALGDEYITDTSSNFEYEPLKDQLINPVTWNTYSVTGLLLDPVLTAEPMEGSNVTETASGDFLLCLDDEAAKPYQDKAVAFVKSYLYYILRGSSNLWGNLDTALSHLTANTQAYKDLYDTRDAVYWNTPHDNIDTSNTTAGGVVIWADNCYSVDVTYDASYLEGGQTQQTGPTTIRVYFLKSDNGFILSNFELNV